MKYRKIPIYCCLIGLLGVGGGCYSYRRPFNAESFAVYEREYEENDFKVLFALDMLTLEDAMRIAAERNPNYVSAFHAVNAARFRYYQSLGAYLPKVDGNFTIGQHFEDNQHLVNPMANMAPGDNAFMTSTTMTASWLIFDGLAREFGALAARKGFERDAALQENVLRLLQRAVAYAYDDVLLATEAERIARANLAFQESALAQAEIRFKYGMVSQADVLNFKILGNMARSDIVMAQYRRAVSVFALTTLMGYPAGALPAKLKFSSLSDQVEPLALSVETYIDIALANRPDLRAYRALLRIANYQKFASYAPFMPVINAFAGGGLNTRADQYRAYHFSHGYYNQGFFDYGIRAEINLFDGFRSFNLVRERKAQEAVASFQLEHNFLECINSVQAAYANYQNCEQQAILFRQMLDWVFEQRQLVNTEYLGGNTTITRLNEAQSNLVVAESRLAVALVDLQKAKAQLDAAVSAPVQTSRSNATKPDSATGLEKLLDFLDKSFPYQPDAP